MVVLLLFRLQMGGHSLLMNDGTAQGSNLCSRSKRFVDLDNRAKVKVLAHNNEQGRRQTSTTAISWKNPGKSWQENLRGPRLSPEGAGIIAKKAISFQEIIAAIMR